MENTMVISTITMASSTAITAAPVTITKTDSTAKNITVPAN